MPNRIQRSFIARPRGVARARQQSRASVAELGYQTVRIRPPWGGYTPDINPLRLAHESLFNASRLIIRDEEIVSAPGWTQVDPNRLPLGDSWSDPGGASQAQPVIALAEFRRLSAASISIEVVAVTALDGGPATIGHLFRLNPSTNQWEERTYAGGGTALVNTVGKLPDWAVFQGGYPGTVDEPFFILCSLTDNVMFYPSVTGGTQYNDLIEVTRAAATYPNNPTNFKAKSCATFEEAAFFLNTVEGGTNHRQRLRRSVRGNAVDLEGVGAGALDFVEFNGEGLRCLGLGDVLACYFEDGVGFARRTQNVSEPVVREYVTKRRGLIGPRAVCQVGRNRHFGIFNDGWFFLDSGGNWQEAGVVPIEGLPAFRWKDTFYSLLNRQDQERTTVEFDPFLDIIQISFPAGTGAQPDATWLYDVRADRVTLDDYTDINGDDMTALVFGFARRQIVAGTLWSAGVGAWSANLGSWLDYAAEFGDQAILHGTPGGYVLVHDPSIYTRIGTNNADNAESPIWTLEMATIPPSGDPQTILVADRLALHYRNVGGPTATLEARVNGLPGAVETSQSRTVAMNEGNVGSGQTALAHFRLPGTRHGVRASGRAPAILHGADLRLLPLGVEDY